jgi:DNA primase
VRIPEAKIDEVRSASDIVDVVSSYVKLKKRGKNYLGLCPFHQEKTPSFTVSGEKQMYHCFGCGVGGNVFTFVMEVEKVSFVEAVRTLAERCGIALPSESAQADASATENEVLYNACKVAGEFFKHNMLDTIEGKLALEYFRHRGFSDGTIGRFGLGYSMNAWDSLLKKAETERLDVAILEKAGLLVRREDGTGYYDRFRGRAMFPIYSPSGRIIAFGARKLREDDALGKYINSPETPIYNKSRVLYGLFQAKEAIRSKEQAILVEGYADLISVFQAGVENVVASSGTALTEDQIQLIGRYAKTIVLVYDADSAGSQAALRGVDLVIEGGLDVKVASLPAGDDPDSFVRKHGGKEFQNLVDGAVSFLDFKAEMFRDKGYLETPEGQTQAVRSIVSTLAKMKDELKRNFYIKHVGEKYGIYETVLFRELEKHLGQERRRIVREEQREAVAEAPAVTGGQPLPAATPLPATERDLLKLMLEHGVEMVNFVFALVTVEAFKHPFARRVVDLLVQRSSPTEPWTAGSLIDEIEDQELKRFVSDIVFSKYEISKGWQAMDSVPEEADPFQMAERCVLIIRRQELDALIAENQRRMKESSARGGDVQEFLQRHQELIMERRELERIRTSAPVATRARTPSA